MNELDVYYRALTDYRKNTTENRECAYKTKLISRANAAHDLIEIETVQCTIKDDWIDAIDKGLEFIRKAIEEDRQFITSNGEVLPIEKVKSVSRDSMEHLAKHSNLITRFDEDSDIVPDKLYTVERLSDYAIYENRFLYMLLCYLRDFITSRYEKIVELTNTYNGRMEMHKVVSTGRRRTEYEFKLTDCLKNDPYIQERNPLKGKIERIDILLKTVLLYISTPLMEQVAKAPLLKPPITETNVLRMNKNFKGAKELYYYVSSYPDEGYTFEKSVKTISPFSDEIGGEFAEVLALGSFLAYEHNLGLEELLKNQYTIQEKQRKVEAENKKLARIAAMKKRIKETGKTEDEYILFLEERVAALEKDSINLAAALSQIESMSARLEELKTEVTGLSETVVSQKNELDRTNDEYSKEISGMKTGYEGRISSMQSEHKSAIVKINNENAEKINSLTEAHSKEISQLNENFNQKVDELKNEHSEAIKALNGSYDLKIASLEGDLLDMRMKVKTANDETSKIKEAKLLSDARLNALRKQYKLFTPSDDFTSEESFNELERQYNVFTNFFKGQWKKVKRKIRKEVLKPSDKDDD